MRASPLPLRIWILSMLRRRDNAITATEHNLAGRGKLIETILFVHHWLLPSL